METNDIPPELLAQMREAAIKAMSSVRDPEAMTKACARMDRMSAEVYKRIGIYDCLYAALAEQETCELVTADDRLVKNLLPQFPFVRPLSSFP